MPQLPEDAVALERPQSRATGGPVVAVLQLPVIANFDDLDPLAREPGVEVRYVEWPEGLVGAAAVVLPGTKHTLAARRWLHERGFDAALAAFPGALVGLCGGYQLLGERISDPDGVEGAGGDEPGLGVLPIATLFAGEKRTVCVAGRSHAPWAPDASIQGYEIHMGRTTVPAQLPPLLTIDGATAQPDGCISADGRIWGCYIHGIFANDTFRRGWLGTLGWRTAGSPQAPDPYERLADHVEAALDPRRLAALLTT